MSLDINYKGVPDWEETCIQTDDEGKQRLHPITQLIGFHTMYISLSEITEKNWQDFYARVSTWEDITGPQLTLTNGDEYNLKPEDIYNHIGLSTNVYENKSKARFLNRHAQIAKDKERQRLNKHYQEAKTEAFYAAKDIANDPS